jgi:hypothetical protein
MVTYDWLNRLWVFAHVRQVDLAETTKGFQNVMVTCPRCRTKFSDAQTIKPGICPECGVDIASFRKAWGLADPVKRGAYDKSIGMEAGISKELPPPPDGAAKTKRSPELQGKNEMRQRKEKKRSHGVTIGLVIMAVIIVLAYILHTWSV